MLNFSTVTSCYVSASQTDAAGGAIHAKRGVGLYRSTVSGSTAQGKGYSFGVGGGIYANAVELDQSTVSGNSAASAMSLGIGGGVYAQTIWRNRSTISGNKASNVAGIVGVHVYLTDSTVSGNRTPTDGFVGGVYAQSVARIISSTIARNSSGGTAAAGLFVPNPAIATVTVQSTIIADNETAGVALDVGTNDGKTIFGQRNLIMTHQAGTTVPADTLTADPLFTLLRDNGGPTQTHALLPGSPAIDHGSNVDGFAFDQRGRLRVIGAFTDIGAYEFDPIRSSRPASVLSQSHQATPALHKLQIAQLFFFPKCAVVSDQRIRSINALSSGALACFVAGHAARGSRMQKTPSRPFSRVRFSPVGWAVRGDAQQHTTFRTPTLQCAYWPLKRTLHETESWPDIRDAGACSLHASSAVKHKTAIVGLAPRTILYLHGCELRAGSFRVCTGCKPVGCGHMCR